MLRNTARTAIKKNERWIYKCSSKYVSFSNIIDPLTSSSYNCISQAELVREKNIARRETCVNHARVPVSPDPHHCYADPDPFFQVLCGIRILLLIEVMRVCDFWSTEPSGLHFEPKKTLTLMQIWIQLFNLMRIRLFQK